MDNIVVVAGTDTGYDDCYDSGSVPSMLLEMKGFIDINDIHKSGSESPDP